MSKILITGATASHGSADAHRRTPRFCGLLNTAFNFSGHVAEMKFMGMGATEKEFKDYSTVIIGMSPFSSMSANKMYTALNTFYFAHKAGKAKVVIDAPDPHLVYQSFKSILSNPSILYKKIYNKREGFDLVTTSPEIQERMYKSIEILLEGDYDVIIPSVPYFSGSREIYGIPNTVNNSLIEINFDNLFADKFFVNLSNKSKYWSIENEKSKWAVSVKETLSKPVINLKRNPYDTEFDYISRMQESYGFLLPVYKNNVPWWSPNIMLALSCGVPVFSDWRLTGDLGNYWNYLPQYVEELSYEERYALSNGQKESYVASTPNWKTSVEKAVETILV